MTDDEKKKLDELKKRRNHISIGDLEAFRVLTQEENLEIAKRLLIEKDPSIKKIGGLTTRITKLQKAIWPNYEIDLFDRFKRSKRDQVGKVHKVPSLSLSKEGAKLNPYIQEILSAWERLLEDAKSIETESSRLVIGAQYSIWNHIASEAAGYFIEKADQDAVLEIAVEKAGELLKGLKGQQYDIVLLYDIGQSFGVNLEKIGDEVLVLVASEPYSGVSDIPDENYLYVDYGDVFSQFHQRSYRYGHPLYGHRIQFKRAGPAFRFVKDRKGMAAYLPWRMIYEHLAGLNDSGDLHLVPGATWWRRPIYVGTRDTAPFTGHDVEKNLLVDETRAFIASIWKSRFEEDRFEEELKVTKQKIDIVWPEIKNQLDG